MIRAERLISGVGFYIDSSQESPTFEQCLKMVAEGAYYNWLRCGCRHGQDMEHWLNAEKELFSGSAASGYNVYVCDLSKRENKGWFRHWEEVHVSPNRS